MWHFFFFKQKTAYEMRISDWSSDVCSSDLSWRVSSVDGEADDADQLVALRDDAHLPVTARIGGEAALVRPCRSEEHTSELQSLMRISYAVFCLKKKNTNNNCLALCWSASFRTTYNSTTYTL